jgi:hypothetical protein
MPADVEEGAGLSSDTWKTGWIADDGGSSSLYATVPTLDRILKGLKYLKQSLWWEHDAREDWMYGCNRRKT